MIKLSLFKTISTRSLFFLMILFVISFSYGLFLAIFDSPVDFHQGEYVRIMYVHVPAAWMSLGIYVMVALLGVCCLLWSSPLFAIFAQAAVPIGMVYSIICLVTGSIWGKPTWGTWWVWDARLTSMLILFFMYLGLMLIYMFFDDRERAVKTASIASILGAVNIPIIKFSVDFWNTLHQPSSFIRSGGVAIHNSMLKPLLSMFFAYIFFFLIMWIVRTHTLINKHKAERRGNTNKDTG